MPTSNPMKNRTKPLSEREARFVEEYLLCLNPRQAALDAGYSATIASSRAFSWVANAATKPHVHAAIEAALAARSTRLKVEADDVLQRWWAIATADPNELTQHRRVACRHCFGIEHHHQWIDGEEFALALAEAKVKAGENEAMLADLPDDRGGYGYDQTKRPSMDCPRCRGEGVSLFHLTDTRQLSRQARMLFAGVTRTKDGTNIKMHDQMKALEMVARHLGMLNQDITVKGDAENPIAVLIQQLQGTGLQPKASAAETKLEAA